MLIAARHIITEGNSGREKRRGRGRALEKSKFLGTSITPEVQKNYLTTLFQSIKK